MTAQSVLAALSIVERGQVRDLGVDYDRRSLVARTLARRNHDFPLSARRQSTARSVLYTKAENGNTSETTWHSCALFMNDNVATQIDGLGHAVTGEDNHWYNGFTEAEWGGDWGVRKAGAETIPPIIARGVLIDVAGFKGVEALPSKYIITPEDLQGALARQGTELAVWRRRADSHRHAALLGRGG